MAGPLEYGCARGQGINGWGPWIPGVVSGGGGRAVVGRGAIDFLGPSYWFAGPEHNRFPGDQPLMSCAQPLNPWAPTLWFLRPSHCYPAPQPFIPGTPTCDILVPNHLFPGPQPLFSGAPAIGFLCPRHCFLGYPPLYYCAQQPFVAWPQPLISWTRTFDSLGRSSCSCTPAINLLDPAIDFLDPTL